MTMAIIDYFYKNNKITMIITVRMIMMLKVVIMMIIMLTMKMMIMMRTRKIKLIIVNYHPPIAEVRGLAS